jgi:PAS domain S-box-containing protein
MYGYQKSEDLVGIKQSQLHGGENVPENIDIMKQFIKSGYRVKEVLSKEVDKEGNNIYISNNVVGIIEDDKLVRTWGSQYNITDRVNAQLELEESEKKYRLLFQTNPVPLIIVDLNELGFLDVNLAVQKLLGFSREEFLHMKLWDIRPDISIFTLGEMKAQILKGAGVQHESKLHTKHDETVLVEVIFDLINYEGQQATLAAFSDITALKDAEKRVLKSIIEGEDNERKRVSIEIHDSLGQNLTAASLNFDSLKQAIQDLKQKDISKFNTGLEFLKSAIDESRNIAHNLMPKAIDDFGLIPSLTSLFNQIEKSTGINVKFYENLSGGRLNRQIELNLYRITQEAINNLIKHSKANEVDIQLLLHKQEIIYTFEDNGIGFDKSSIEITGKGMGLKSIFNRVVTMSGTFDLDSSPERGTSITIEIPI